jgi:two-component system nitrogen regulation sensor histidine kinase NtrY
MAQISFDGDKTERRALFVRIWHYLASFTAAKTRLRRFAILLLLAASLAAAATSYLLLTGTGRDGSEPQTVLAVLYGNLFLLLLVGVLVGRQVAKLWVERRRGLAGSRLHVRLVLMFGLVAMTPAVLVSAFSITFFDFGVREWFSERVGAAVKSAEAVAEAYLQEHQQTIKGQILLIANDLNRDSAVLSRNINGLRKVVRVHSVVRNLPEVVVFNRTGSVLARSALSLSFEFQPVSEAAMREASNGEVVVIPAGKDEKVRALVRLNGFSDAFLLIGRYVDSDIIAHVSRTERAVAQYRALELNWLDIQITFAGIFTMSSLLLLMAAIWVGLNMANRLARPVSALIAAAERVSVGDLSTRIDKTEDAGELKILGASFNKMAQQLEMQRFDLITANRQLDQRRIFTEAVLQGVSAGIIGLTSGGNINLSNHIASDLLATDLTAFLGKSLVEAVPEFSELMDKLERIPKRSLEREIVILRGERRINLFVRLTVEIEDQSVVGYVLTFDDISDLLSAQRIAAWADVARRIAHEIKNPLTPIQLAAERLKRKYGAEIQTDRAVFNECTDTIVRQVDDIGRMVDEFSAFARMPTPQFEAVNLSDLMHEMSQFHGTAYQGITVHLTGGRVPFIVQCDARQVRQAVTNLIKNAAESVASCFVSGELTAGDGSISLGILRRGDHIVVVIEDNGRGLPHEDRHRLTEPYVTTRNRGTGLGLAIVKKIMEDHGGMLKLSDSRTRGAVAEMYFPAIDGDMHDPDPSLTKDV